MRRPQSQSENEAGVTVLEVTIASGILLLALAIFLGSLVSTQNTEQYTRLRNEALDDLRLMANTFAKEARQAASVTSNSASKVVMVTNVNSVPTTVTYEVAGAIPCTTCQLVRTTNSSTRVFLVKLVSNAVFSYNGDPFVIPAPQAVRSVKLGVGTKLSAKYPSVSLSTEVSLRNVR